VILSFFKGRMWRGAAKFEIIAITLQYKKMCNAWLCLRAAVKTYLKTYYIAGYEHYQCTAFRIGRP
jgi:hypothetical protein